jgi:TPP-dependent indolepyruvate ferredoxin oxidoreductase alpha subunit
MKRFLETGNFAITEGAILAGCRFFGGYPITPATEIAEAMSSRLPQEGGVYLQPLVARRLWWFSIPVASGRSAVSPVRPAKESFT